MEDCAWLGGFTICALAPVGYYIPYDLDYRMQNHVEKMVHKRFEGVRIDFEWVPANGVYVFTIHTAEISDEDLPTAPEDARRIIDVAFRRYLRPVEKV